MATQKDISGTFAQKALRGIAEAEVRQVRSRVRVEVGSPADAVTNSIMQAIGKEMRKQGLPGFWGPANNAWRENVHAMVTGLMVDDALGKISDGLKEAA
jgi:hypothetical protein